nr:MAG TPA: GAGA binding protein-like family [Caudoviricetes sp.]
MIRLKKYPFGAGFKNTGRGGLIRQVEPLNAWPETLALSTSAITALLIPALASAGAFLCLRSGQGSWVETCCTTRRHPPVRALNQTEVTQQ